MRLRLFEAQSMPQAMAMMRDELGDDAILLDSITTDEGVRLTAALDSDEVDLADLLEDVPDQSEPNYLRDLIEYHKPDDQFAQLLLRKVDDFQKSTAEELIASLLDHCLDMETLQPQVGKPLLFVGLPGAGKTTICARYALSAIMQKQAVQVASIEQGRAGAREQLDGLLAPMQMKAQTLEKPQAIKLWLKNDLLSICDSLGVNPFSKDDMRDLAKIISSSGCQPILVLEAGHSADDAVEIANNFKAVGVKHFIASKLDLCRRFGAVLSVAGRGMVLCGATVSPLIGKRVSPIGAKGLMRLIMRAVPMDGDCQS